MTKSKRHDHMPTPVAFPLHEPLSQSTASSARLRQGSKLAVNAGEFPVGAARATTPEPAAWPAEPTGTAPASQHEFYQYFGLALLALIAITVLVAARS